MGIILHTYFSTLLRINCGRLIAVVQCRCIEIAEENQSFLRVVKLQSVIALHAKSLINRKKSEKKKKMTYYDILNK